MDVSPEGWLLGGHHVMCCSDFQQAVVMVEGQWGLMLVGPYHKLLHALRPYGGDVLC